MCLQSRVQIPPSALRFFMQCSSFLEYQGQVQQQGKDNAQKLFGIEKIPNDNPSLGG
jgi:hypothetical protein